MKYLALLAITILVSIAYTMKSENIFELNYIGEERREAVNKLPFSLSPENKMRILISSNTGGNFSFLNREDVLKNKHIMSLPVWRIYLCENKNFWRKSSVFLEIHFNQNDVADGQKKIFVSDY